MTLAEQLNLYQVNYETTPQGVKLEACTDDKSLFNDEGLVTDPQLNAFLNVFGTFGKAYIDDHPHDRRAGLVCFVEHNGEKAWYKHSECRWLPS
jgi:hypothetical protein